MAADNGGRPLDQSSSTIGDARRYLEMTMEGEQWTATLYRHIFAIAHNCRRVSPQRRPPRE
jgi:hypothetical protein